MTFGKALVAGVPALLLFFAIPLIVSYFLDPFLGTASVLIGLPIGIVVSVIVWFKTVDWLQDLSNFPAE